MKSIIIANGDPPKKRDIEFFRKRGFNFIVCADGGANSARKINVVPNIIIGDLDSITEETKDFFYEKCKIKQIKRQNDTDVEKSLKYIIQNKFEEVLLLGATGDRLDHTICNLGIVLKFYPQIKISVLHKKSYLVPVRNNLEFTSVKGETISLYGFDRKTKIISQGLKYPLKDESLLFGERESTSNVAVSDKVKLSIRGGIIFLIREFEILRKYDLL